jgi:hypothetical protein
MKMRGLKNWLMLKRLSFSSPHKDIIVKTHSSPIVLPWSIEVGGIPTSNMLKPAQISHPSTTPPLAQNAQEPMKESQVSELQDNRERGPPSPAGGPNL